MNATPITTSMYKTPFIRWTEYKFSPSKIDKATFVKLKEILNSNSKYEISPKKSFIEFFKEFNNSILTMCLMGIILGVIGVIIDWYNNKLNNLFESFIGGIILVVFWKLIFGGPKSVLSYLLFASKHNSYFKYLKSVIIKSKDYESFIDNHVQYIDN